MVQLTGLTFLIDELSIRKEDGPNQGSVPLLKTGIAWSSDKKNKFRNPDLDPSKPKQEALKEGRYFIL